MISMKSTFCIGNRLPLDSSNSFHSNNSQEEYKIQMMIVAACDLLEKLVAIYFQGAKKTKKFHEEFLALWLNVLEKSYQDGGSPYCVNDTAKRLRKLPFIVPEFYNCKSRFKMKL
ncbi:uncharacterized protein TRIADDRAFT_60655 [Trichoplax adhaerens]|uniref:Uncharacterized protein n=1 Tax=Trichoplax adhaerens TaxID=10228 RepID=B3S908_TRIAD|nr:predicted protein [Trichoplax adhaerens]EDV20796.1 predicted protein [Trichoplax adhaerens]|eukprot:XP_002116737.1 predicted protein [Trichoplax adhaerens]